MENRLQVLVARIKELERELVQEIQKKEEEYYYKIFGRRVAFEEWIKHEQKTLVKKLIPFIREAPILNILSAPIIWAVLPAALLLDGMKRPGRCRRKRSFSCGAIHSTRIASCG